MAKEKHIQTKGRIEDVPPWCYMKPGMTPMEAARVAIRELGIKHPLDVLLTLWALQGGMTPKSHTTEQKGLIE